MTGIEIRKLNKSFGELKVFEELDLNFRAGGSYAVTGSSGAGKTTLFKLITGLLEKDGGEILFPESKACIEKADGGNYFDKHRDNADKENSSEAERGKLKKPSEISFSMVFQEDRLCEYLSAEENILLCEKGIFNRKSAAAERIRAELLRLLPAEALSKPVKKLSGGQKRRIAVIRAMTRDDADIIIMDEPFTGMDRDTRKKTAEYILEKKGERLLIISTHSAEEAELLHAKSISVE